MDGYVVRVRPGNRAAHGTKKMRPGDRIKHYSSIWLVKWKNPGALLETSSRGCISVRKITFPSEYVGKRIRLKVEVLPDE